jgi:spore coat protein CotF
MEEIKNEKESIIKSKCMSEEDILNDILMCEKNISNNYSISLNEMSNKQLFKIVFGLLNESKNIARDIYNLAFEKGWYTVKTESESEITKAENEYRNKLKELS